MREKQLVYDEANSKLKVLQADLATKKSKKAELENEVETCSRKLERADSPPLKDSPGAAWRSQARRLFLRGLVLYFNNCLSPLICQLLRLSWRNFIV